MSTITIPAPGPDATRVQLPVPAHALPQRTPSELLAMARRGLEEAAAIRPAGLSYATAHLAALRAAAAVLAARAEPAPGVRRSRPTSIWTLVVQVAPELSDWCAMFAAGAMKRAAAEAGIPRVVTAAEAVEIRTKAAMFVEVAAVLVGDAASGSPGDVIDSDGLPLDLSALVETIHARMGRTSRAEQTAFAAAWTGAIQAAAGVDLSEVGGRYFDWRDGNIAASDAEAGAKLVELVRAVTR